MLRRVQPMPSSLVRSEDGSRFCLLPGGYAEPACEPRAPPTLLPIDEVVAEAVDEVLQLPVYKARLQGASRSL